ncbi:MAG: O-antigen ligase family protein [Gammaproteobacteria bacterium]|nr:O-antigen ligase family protein [Gammaproteobacteria bacterium]
MAANRAMTAPWAPSRTARRLLVALIIIQFFPIPPLPGLGFAPENVFFLITGLYMLRRFVQMLGKDSRVMQLTVLFLVYALLRMFHNLVHSVSPFLPFEHFRIVIFILALAQICADDIMLRKVIKLLLVIAAIQIVFGLLIYVFGSPFADIRNWMLRVNVYEAFISKGSQLAGLYGPPHIFSYMLAAVPVLSVTMYLLERRLVWLGWMLLMLLGLFINAERAAMAALTVCTLLLVWKTSRALSSVLIVGVVGLGLVGVQQVVGYLSASNEQQLGSAYAHGTLTERLGETSVEEVISRIGYSLGGVSSVMKHPLLGPSKADYAREALGKDSGELLAGGEVKETLASHNHYVNIGVNAGVLGWVVAVWFFAILRRMHRISVERYRRNRPAYIRHCGITLALLAALMNAFFHNSGVFSPDLMTCLLIGLLIADYRLALREPQLRDTADEGEAGGEEEGANSNPRRSASRGPAMADQSGKRRLAPRPVG